MTEENLVTVKVLQDNVEVGSVKREEGDLATIPKAEAEILEKNNLAEKTDKEVPVEEAKKPTGETNDTSETDDDFTATAKPGGVPEGEHAGTIIDLNKKQVDVGKAEDATYLDIAIDVPEEDAKITVGYNFYISNNSELGKLLQRCGIELEVGAEYDLEKILIDTPVKFYARTNEDGYTEIKKDTVAPKEGGN